MSDVANMSNQELLDEYNFIRNVIDGIFPIGYDKRDLYRLEELVIEMTRREEG